MNELTIIEPQHTTVFTVIPRSEISTVMAADENDILGKLAKELSGFEADVSTDKGRKEIASKAYKVAQAKQELIRLADRLKEGAQKTIKATNAEVRIIEDRMDALKASVRQPLTDFENREKARVAAHEAALAEINSFSAIPDNWPSGHIATRLEELEQSELRTRDWQEFTHRAIAAVKASHDSLKRAHNAALDREAEAAELERLRAEKAERDRQEAARLQAEREARIAAEAAERARLAAERKAAEEAAAAERKVAEELARIDAEARKQAAAAEAERQRAERETREAEERATRAEAAKVAAEAKAKADAEAAARKAEADRIAAVEAERQRVERERAAAEAADRKRAADKAHRQKINSEALADLVAAGLTEDTAKTAIVAVAQGRVRHIEVKY